MNGGEAGLEGQRSGRAGVGAGVGAEVGAVVGAEVPPAAALLWDTTGSREWRGGESTFRGLCLSASLVQIKALRHPGTPTRFLLGPASLLYTLPFFFFSQSVCVFCLQMANFSSALAELWA